MAVFAAGAIGWLIAVASSPENHRLPLWPVIPFGFMVLIGLYGMIAPLRGWWPWNAPDEAPEVPAPAPAPGPPPLSATQAPAQTEDSHRPIFDEAPPELADMSPASLQELFAGRTKAQGNVLMKQHVGKPVRVSGEVRAVSLVGAYAGNVHLGGRSAITFVLFFDAGDKEAETQLLLTLNTGDKLTVSGLINEIGATVVALENAKLIDVRKPVS